MNNTRACSRGEMKVSNPPPCDFFLGASIVNILMYYVPIYDLKPYDLFLSMTIHF